MKNRNIKRLIFTCTKSLQGFHGVKEVKDVKIYHKLDGVFKEEAVEEVYQLYNKEGKEFINGPFQKCKICKNWFKFTESELQFLKEKELKGTCTCKRCKGRRVRV